MAGMEFLIGREPLELKEIRTRGKSALLFQRKSFLVFLNETLAIAGRNGSDMAYLKRFKLISMAIDFTYIENKIGLGILEAQGIYLLVEDPEQYYHTALSSGHSITKLHRISKSHVP